MATWHPEYSPSLTSANPPWKRICPAYKSSCRRMYEEGTILHVRHILERSRKPHRQSSRSRHECARACTWALSCNCSDHDKLLKSRTWSRKSMNSWASLPQRFLASAILDGEVKRDWTSERHSLNAISVDLIFVQNRSSEVSSSGWSICWGRRKGIVVSGGLDS